MRFKKLTPKRWIYDLETDLYLCPYCGIPVAAPDDDPVLLPDFCPVCCRPVADCTAPVSPLPRTFEAR